MLCGVVGRGEVFTARDGDGAEPGFVGIIAVLAITDEGVFSGRIVSFAGDLL